VSTRATLERLEPAVIRAIFRAPERAPRPQRASELIARQLVPAALVLAASVGLYLRWTTTRQSSLQYTTAAFERGAIRAQLIATGTVSALDSVSVGSRVPGRIESLRVDCGDAVKKGEVIATLEPWSFRLAAAQAKAELAAAVAALTSAEARKQGAETEFDRVRDLHVEGMVSGAEYDQAQANQAFARADVVAARANVKRARVALERAEFDLSSAAIVSPIDGSVVARHVNVGQSIADSAVAATTLFTIVEDLTRMRIDTPVPERELGKIRAGTPVTLTVAAHPDRSFAGHVRQLGDEPRLRRDLMTYHAVVDVDNREQLLKPGMTATVAFTYAERSAALRVPNAALQFQPQPAMLARMSDAGAPVPGGSDSRTLWVLRSGTVLLLSVGVGISDGAWTEVTRAELQPGDRVILSATLDPRAARSGSARELPESPERTMPGQ
jgi:HlyD family secretion protein